MKPHRRWLVAMVAIGALLLPACQKVSSSDYSFDSEPWTVEPIEGTDLARVTLTADGARRIGLETAPMRGKTVPATAIWIDVEGQAWVYAAQEPLTFVREAVAVKRYVEDRAVLSDAPAAGTGIVTVGIAELIGSEFGI